MQKFVRIICDTYCLQSTCVHSSAATLSYMANGTCQALRFIFCHMDDVLVFSKVTHEHDTRLEQVLQQIQAVGVTLKPHRELCA